MQRRSSQRILIGAAVVALVTTLSGQTTALAAPRKAAPSTTSSTTTTTLPTVPAAAEPLLRHLISVAGSIAADNERVAALSERYDYAKVQATADAARARVLDVRTRKAEARLAQARLRLRSAAIEAYVTGASAAADSSLLSNTLSTESMVDVYASAATDHVDAAIRTYDTALSAVRRLDAAAHQTAYQAARYLAQIGTLKAEATKIQEIAFLSIVEIKAKLQALVGPKEYARLISPEPIGSPYKGPNLAGSAATSVASALQGLEAVAAAKHLLGVPYVYGGASSKGVDCSGLTMLAWYAAGVHLEHSATVQWEESVPVPLAHLQPGDLLFYHFAHDGNTPITHVVMYVGSGPYGAATVIQAAHTGTDVAYAPLFLEGLVSAGRP